LLLQDVFPDLSIVVGVIGRARTRLDLSHRCQLHRRVMCSLMHTKVSLLVEPPVATGKLADERLFSRVNSLMNFHIILQAESLSADIARKGLLPCVNDDVALQLVLILKDPAAPWMGTPKRLAVMDLKMLLEQQAIQEVAAVVADVAEVLFLLHSVLES